MIILIWIAAIVAANLSVGHFGPSVSILNAFFLIGLTLTTRDILHKRWEGRCLKIKMGTLIAAGGLISYLTQPAAGSIALGSIVAFAVSEVIDSIVFHRTRSINKSNLVSAAVDSVIFPVIAFGGFPVLIILGQWAAKVFGGAVWAFLLQRKTAIFAASLFGVSLSAANLQVHHNEYGNYFTVESFTPGDTEIYAFADFYQYGANVKIGEVAVYSNRSKFNPTIQVEFGDSDFFEIEEVLLAGVRYKGLELLLRSDEEIQLTYVWFYRYKSLQFNGYVDVWGFDEVQAISQPQVWYWLNNYVAVGGEIFVRATEGSLEVTPSLAMKFDLQF